MHRISVLSILGLILLPSVLPAEVPHQINMQSIIYDASGNVTTSDRVDLTIRILDEGNNVVFSETHAGVQVIEGAVNVNIGSESGGVPLEILDPETGSKVVDVQVNGTNPFEMMPLGSVPYAMWAEKAVTVADDSIGSAQIINGSIKAEDIDPLAFSDLQGQAAEGQLPGSVATDAELNAHINSGTAHPASAIVVSGNFITFVATNAQEALQKLDQKLADEIVNRQNAVSTVTTNLNNEIAARGAGDAGLQGQINAVNANITNLQTTTSSINNIPGTLDDGKIASTIARDSEVTNGDSNLQGQINNLNTTVADHENRIDKLEGAGIVVVDGYVEWQTNTNKANGGALSGTDSSSWSLSGNSTNDDKWVTITRSAITIPNGCVAIASGTSTPHVASGNQTFFDDDDQSFLRITYSGQQINLVVFAQGDDGDFDVNFRIIAHPTSPGNNCNFNL